MPTDQFKIILDALQSMGATGQSAFIWWLVLDKALPVIGWLLTFTGLLWLAVRLMHATMTGVLGREVRDMLGIGQPLGPFLPGNEKQCLLK